MEFVWSQAHRCLYWMKMARRDNSRARTLRPNDSNLSIKSRSHPMRITRTRTRISPLIPRRHSITSTSVKQAAPFPISQRSSSTTTRPCLAIAPSKTLIRSGAYTENTARRSWTRCWISSLPRWRASGENSGAARTIITVMSVKRRSICQSKTCVIYLRDLYQIQGE